MEGNGNVLESINNSQIGWSGAIGFNPQHTTLKYVNFDGTTYFTGTGDEIWGVTLDDCFNKGVIRDAPGHGSSGPERVKVVGKFINNGDIGNRPNTNSYGLYLYLKGDLENNGIINNSLIEVSGQSAQSIWVDKDADFSPGVVEIFSEIQGSTYQ